MKGRLRESDYSKSDDVELIPIAKVRLLEADVDNLMT